MGKRTQLKEYPHQKRAGLGVKVAEITKKTGPVAAARLVTPEHRELVISTKDGQTMRLPMTKQSIPILTRPTQGVILMRVSDGDNIAAVALTYKQMEDEE